MDYTAVTPVRKDKTLSRADVLGIVASNHQAIADRLGPDMKNCLELAKLNSDAVDFCNLRPKWFPDFMGKDPDVSYPSTRPLGMMYRLIEPAPEYQPLDDLCIDTRLTSRRVPPSYLKAAGEMKQNYDVDLEGIMRQYVDPYFDPLSHLM
ncbi:hypothetical protein C8F04DRAFT_1283392 [Mycena alexandri]|uniref:RNA-dependent RNA polymerase n=1 Tax=Mycena alexandri TaxID=1745969 RepID=A0AAD6RVU9_9AGAR|nr:hypothetical protein C8F04DRAFT_1283392 [Mycena alexandri]